MFDMKSVVCATDLSEGSNKALYLAAFIAIHYQTKLVVAHVIDLPAVTPYGETMVDPQELQARVEQSAKTQVTDILHGFQGLDWELKVSIGYPAKELQEIVKQTGAGLLVAATHIRSGIERLLLGSVTRKLIFTLKVPFLVVPGNLPLERSAIHKTESILISTDFSNDAEKALDWGLDLARAFDAKRVILATVIESNQLDQILTTDPQKEEGVANKLVDQLTQKLEAKIPQDLKDRMEVRVLAGQPHEELNKFAILNRLDLIVMGVHGRGFIENLMVGSTTDRLIRLGQFPVLAVRGGACCSPSEFSKEKAK
ncbi:MAG: universal stress protein [Deltaproteobacteria bacterium]|jgi:nucleotide-binding universal stress UspA family protein|nr:universal stress protein [Deltaproteobacteria bacterium]